MKEKLTLSIEKQIKQRAKHYARTTGQSVSQMVEQYLNTVATKDKTFKPEPGSVTESLMGSMELPEKYKNMDYKEIKQQVLTDRHDI